MCKLHISPFALAVNHKCVYCTFMIPGLHPFLMTLARLLMSQSLRFPEFSEMMKKAYVDAAADEVDKVTDSALSLNTGLQRRDVARLRKMDAPQTQGSNPLSRIVALWLSDERFAGRDLPKQGENSFDTLARDIGKDIHPRTVLDALEKAGTVRIVDDYVHLLVPSFQPSVGSAEQMAYLTANLGDHLAAAVGNTQGAQFFERAVHYDGLTEAQVQKLHEAYSALQMDVLQKINQQAADMQRETDGRGAMRFRAGGYFWQEDTSKGKKS
ncbi:MAG: DUF6502 family protein [Planktomarina sp.]